MLKRAEENQEVAEVQSNPPVLNRLQCAVSHSSPIKTSKSPSILQHISGQIRVPTQDYSLRLLHVEKHWTNYFWFYQSCTRYRLWPFIKLVMYHRKYSSIIMLFAMYLYFRLKSVINKDTPLLISLRNYGKLTKSVSHMEPSRKVVFTVTPPGSLVVF